MEHNRIMFGLWEFTDRVIQCGGEKELRSEAENENTSEM